MDNSTPATRRGFGLGDVINKRLVVGPNRVNDIDHFVHGGNEGDPVRFASGSFLLKEGSKKIGAKHRDTGGIVKPRPEYLVAAFGDIPLTPDARAGLVDSGFKADDGVLNLKVILG